MRFLSPTANQRLRLTPADHTEERNGNILLIWGRIPYWTVVDRELFELLNSLDGTRTLNKITGGISVPRQVLDFLNGLLKLGVLTDENKPAKLDMEHKWSVPAIENISINLTRRCNLRCGFCYNLNDLHNDGDSELSAEEFIDFFKQAASFCSKNCSLIILGGEPLLYPDKLFQVAEYGIRQGMKTQVSTNALLVTDEVARRAKELGLDVQVSIDGHNAALNDQVRGKGSFDRAVQGIRTLVRNGVHTIVSMVVHEGNRGHIESYYRFASELGVKEARFIPLKRMGGASDGRFTPVKTVDLVRETYEMLKRHPDYLSLMGRDAFSVLANTCKYSHRKQSCGTGSQTLLLDSDGSIYPSLNTNVPEFKVANLRDSSFRFSEIWRDSSILRNIRLLTSVNRSSEECSSCPVLYWCLGGCHGETYASTGRLNDPPYNCEDWKRSIIEMLWILAERPDLGRPGLGTH